MEVVKSLVGQTLVCAETGKEFVGASQGCTYNYAHDFDGAVLSDEGVDIREKRELLNRSKPVTGYLSSDAKRFTGWKGNTLGTVVFAKKTKLTRWSHVHGNTILSVKVRDVHGGLWYGWGNSGICITLRAYKGG